MNEKSVKSLLPITYVNSTFVGSQKNWTMLTKEAYANYLAFKKPSCYLYDAKVIIKFDNVPLNKFVTAHTLNSTVDKWGLSHVIIEHIKGMGNILAHCIQGYYLWVSMAH